MIDIRTSRLPLKILRFYARFITFAIIDSPLSVTRITSLPRATTSCLNLVSFVLAVLASIAFLNSNFVGFTNVLGDLPYYEGKGKAKLDNLVKIELSSKSSFSYIYILSD